MRSQLSKYPIVFLLFFAFISAALPPAAVAQATGTAAAVDYSKQLQAIEDKLEARRKELGIPGVSLVIVKDDKIIYIKGLGYKDLENKIAVTPDTQFAIGSATKAFTALSVLMSMDEGKLSLEDSPKKYLPYFKMYDPDTDKNITIRDLLCHRSGLNRTDLAMITGRLTRAELIQVAAQAKPTAKLGEKFQYQNIMFAAAGEIVAQVQKEPWEKFIPERIFKPLGMNNSSMSIAQMEKAKDFSFGYDYNFDTKTTAKLPFREITQVAPAGSIDSSARDMAEWLRFVMNGGEAGGKRLVSEKGFEEWLKPQMKVAGKTSYGFGWFLQDWNGLKVVQHGGNIDGFNSMVAMIPEKKLGFVLLTNVSASPLGNEMMPVVWENLLGSPKQTIGAELTTDSMQKYIGLYRLEAAKINIEIKSVGDKLVMAVPGQPEYTLDPTSPRNFKMLGAPDGFAVRFDPADGDATSMYLQQPQGNYVLPRLNPDGTLAKVEAPKSTGAEAARELVGTYSGPGGESIKISESDGSVTLNITGQQPYTLNEKAKDTYSLSPLPDTYSIKSKRDAAGKVIAIVVTQPEGEFEFKRTGDAAKPKIAMTVDELAAKTIAAVGGEAAWRKITSRVVMADVDLANQGVQAKAVSYAKAPNKTANEITLTALGKTIGSGYDFFDGAAGEEAYTFAPVQKFSGKKLDDARLGADFYGPLDWKANFKKIEITGTAKVGDEEVYVVSFEPNAGTPFKEYYSTTTFLLLKREGVVTSSTSQQQLPYTITFSDYREVDGIKLAFKNVNSEVSNGDIITVVRSVKHNVPIDDKVFGPQKLQ